MGAVDGHERIARERERGRRKEEKKCARLKYSRISLFFSPSVMVSEL